jgi:hypothetical protein
MGTDPGSSLRGRLYRSSDDAPTSSFAASERRSAISPSVDCSVAAAALSSWTRNSSGGPIALSFSLAARASSNMDMRSIKDVLHRDDALPPEFVFTSFPPVVLPSSGNSSGSTNTNPANGELFGTTTHGKLHPERVFVNIAPTKRCV